MEEGQSERGRQDQSHLAALLGTHGQKYGVGDFPCRDGSPTMSESSARTASSLSVDGVSREHTTTPSKGHADSRRENASPNFAPSGISPADLPLSFMSDPRGQRKSHRRTQSEVHIRHPLNSGEENVSFDIANAHFGSGVATLANGMGDGDTLLTELMNFSTGGDKLDFGFSGSSSRQNIGQTGTGSTAGAMYSGSAPHHSRSVSVDETLLASFHPGTFKEPSGPYAGQHRRNNSRSSEGGLESMGFDDENDGDDAIRKILAGKKMHDVDLIDPKRAKRILANRQSAARSKERKTRYISELEEKVTYYEQQSTALKATLSLLQRENSALAEVNEDMNTKMQLLEKLCLQREVENKQLQGEVELLRQAAGQMSTSGSLVAASPTSVEQQLIALLQQVQPQRSVLLEQEQQQQLQLLQLQAALRQHNPPSHQSRGFSGASFQGSSAFSSLVKNEGR